MTVISQAEVNTSLVNKLTPGDIEISSEFCKRSAMRNRLALEIAAQHECQCPEKGGRLFTFPEGNVNSKIMFVGEPPSEFDGQTHTTMFDANGRLMTVILDKLGLKRDNIYVTNVAKCCIKNGDAQALSYTCASHFLIREIDLVRPKVIITLGLIAANVFRMVLCNDPGTIDDPALLKGMRRVINTSNHECTVFHTVSPAFVLSKSGALYNKYKGDLWTDIQAAWAEAK